MQRYSAIADDCNAVGDAASSRVDRRAVDVTGDVADSSAMLCLSKTSSAKKTLELQEVGPVRFMECGSCCGPSWER